MRTKYVEIWERSRFVGASDSERYAIRVKIYGTLDEVESVRDAILRLQKEGS